MAIQDKNSQGQKPVSNQTQTPQADQQQGQSWQQQGQNRPAQQANVAPKTGQSSQAQANTNKSSASSMDIHNKK